jgi:hypothetical protein
MEAAICELRPECLIVTYTPDPLPRQQGAPVPIVSLDLLPEDARVAGIYQQIALAAAAAVDFVIEQIHHGKRGVPTERKKHAHRRTVVGSSQLPAYFPATGKARAVKIGLEN